MKTKVDSDVEGAWVVGLRAWILELVRAEVEAAVAGATKPLEIFTTREAAQFARVSTVTVLRWVRDGRVLAFGVGRRARFKREDIERVLAEGSRRRFAGASWRSAPVPATTIPLRMNTQSADALLKEEKALLRGWSVPDHITPELLANHDFERHRLRQIMKQSPTSMSDDDLRLFAAEMNWLRWATQSTK